MLYGEPLWGRDKGSPWLQKCVQQWNETLSVMDNFQTQRTSQLSSNTLYTSTKKTVTAIHWTERKRWRIYTLFGATVILQIWIQDVSGLNWRGVGFKYRRCRVQIQEASGSNSRGVVFKFSRFRVPIQKSSGSDSAGVRFKFRRRQAQIHGV